jgi:hypothetical protein
MVRKLIKNINVKNIVVLLVLVGFVVGTLLLLILNIENLV